MPEKAWKVIERNEAKRLRAERVKRHGEWAPDAMSDWLCIEIKARKKLPTWITDAVRSARAKANERQLGIAVLHAMGEHDSYVIMSRNDFIAWFGWTKEGRKMGLKEEIKELERQIADTKATGKRRADGELWWFEWKKIRRLEEEIAKAREWLRATTGPKDAAPTL